MNFSGRTLLHGVSFIKIVTDVNSSPEQNNPFFLLLCCLTTLLVAGIISGPEKQTDVSPILCSK